MIMKKLLLVSCVAPLLLGLVACGSPAASTPDPVTVYQSFLEAVNAKQLDEAMSFIADDAVFIDGMGKYSGKEEIQAYLLPQINVDGKGEASDFVNTNGRLDYNFKAFVSGNEVYSGTSMTIVEDGKIIFDGKDYIWNRECEQDASQSFCGEKYELK
jgi:hypothetical protein